MRFKSVLIGLCFSAVLSASSTGHGQIPRPVDVLGFELGADYKLAKWKELVSYYRQLDAATGRVRLIEIGRSVLGKPLLLLYISSEGNLRRLEDWRKISEELARARINEQKARQHASEGLSLIHI